MSGYKYPYIADKKMYAAVMGACKWIRESGYFNKAVSYYADKYGVDEEQLAKEIRKRQAAGQKVKTGTNKGKKMKFFIVAATSMTDADPMPSILRRPEILKGYTTDGIKNRFYDWDERRTRAADYGGSYAPVFGYSILGNANGYDSKEEAEKVLSAILEAKTGYLWELQKLGIIEDYQ